MSAGQVIAVISKAAVGSQPLLICDDLPRAAKRIYYKMVGQFKATEVCSRSLLYCAVQGESQGKRATSISTIKVVPGWHLQRLISSKSSLTSARRLISWVAPGPKGDNQHESPYLPCIFQLLQAVGVPWLVAAGTPCAVCLFSRGLLSVPVCLKPRDHQT